MNLIFNAPSEDKSELEDAGDFTPRFDDRGLITAIVTDAHDGELLMVARIISAARAERSGRRARHPETCSR